MQEWGDWTIFPFGIMAFFAVIFWVGVICWIINLMAPDKETDEERKWREHWERIGIKAPPFDKSRKA